MIKVGDYVPDARLFRMSSKGSESISPLDWFSGINAVVFAVPGAFTPLCSAQHLPGYLTKSAEFIAKGIDKIVCIAVNDVYVMDAWGRDQGVTDEIEMFADGSALFTKAAGLVLDLSDAGFGIRSLRYAMMVRNRVITHLNIEKSGKFEVSNAESMLELL